MNTRFLRETASLSTVLAATLSLVSFSFNARAVLAADFNFQENQVVVPQPSQNVSRTVSGNTLTITNAVSLVNTSATVTPETIFTYPFLYSTIDRGGTFVSLAWDNAQDAYVTDNYDGLGNSLAVSLLNFTQRVRLDTLADATGNAPLPRAIPCSDISCPPPSPFPNLPPATQDADDAIPFLALGSFAPNETKVFDLVIDFDYEDNRTGPINILPVFSLLSATSQPVPEPATVLGLILGGGAIASMKRNNSSV
ncbi:MAG: PEP-CTERM sorting domain-containing protein [Cyanobacteria bacterium J06632_3]